MLVAIQFNDQSGLETYKIGNVRPYGLLATKFEAVELPIAQGKPEFAFDVCLFAAQFPGEIVFHIPRRPLPQGERALKRCAVAMRRNDQGAAAMAEVLGVEEPVLAAMPMMIPNITTPVTI